MNENNDNDMFTYERPTNSNQTNVETNTKNQGNNNQNKVSQGSNLNNSKNNVNQNKNAESNVSSKSKNNVFILIIIISIIVIVICLACFAFSKISKLFGNNNNSAQNQIDLLNIIEEDENDTEINSDNNENLNTNTSINTNLNVNTNMNTNNTYLNESTSLSSSNINSPAKVNYSGFSFEIPSDLKYKVDTNGNPQNLRIINSEEGWTIIIIEIKKGSAQETIDSVKDLGSFANNLMNFMGANASKTTTEEIDNVEYLVMQSGDGLGSKDAYYCSVDLDETYTTDFAIVTDANVDYNLALKALTNIIKNSEYVGN